MFPPPPGEEFPLKGDTNLCLQIDFSNNPLLLLLHPSEMFFQTFQNTLMHKKKQQFSFASIIYMQTMFYL